MALPFLMLDLRKGRTGFEIEIGDGSSRNRTNFEERTRKVESREKEVDYWEGRRSKLEDTILCRATWIVFEARSEFQL